MPSAPRSTTTNWGECSLKSIALAFFRLGRKWYISQTPFTKSHLMVCSRQFIDHIDDITIARVFAQHVLEGCETDSGRVGTYIAAGLRMSPGHVFPAIKLVPFLDQTLFSWFWCGRRALMAIGMSPVAPFQLGRNLKWPVAHDPSWPKPILAFLIRP